MLSPHLQRILEETVERATGKSAQYLRDTPLSELQEQVRQRDGELRVRTGSGRKFLTTQEIDRMLDKALKTK